MAAVAESFNSHVFFSEGEDYVRYVVLCSLECRKYSSASAAHLPCSVRLLGSLLPARNRGGVAACALLNPEVCFVIFMAHSRGTYLIIIPVSSLGTVQTLFFKDVGTSEEILDKQ